jgi:hypothetical protein
MLTSHHIDIINKTVHFNWAFLAGRAMTKAQRDIKRILRVLNYAKEIGNISNDSYFTNYVIIKLPFRIHTIRTDNGHEFQTKFYWYLEDLGIRHIYKPRSPRLNRKAERSHRTDDVEFYQLLSYTGDMDLNRKLS